MAKVLFIDYFFEMDYNIGKYVHMRRQFMKVEFDVKISAKDLFLFLFNNSYRKFTGVLISLMILAGVFCPSVILAEEAHTQLSYDYESRNLSD